MGQLDRESSKLSEEPRGRENLESKGLPAEGTGAEQVLSTQTGTAPRSAVRSTLVTDQVFSVKDWAFLSLNVLAILVAIYAVLQSNQSETRSLRVEADFRLAKAWDLLGGEVGVDEIGQAAPAKSDCVLANRELDAVLILWPDDVTAYRYKGVHARLCGDNEDAIEFFQKSLELDPKQRAAHNSLGFALAELGRTEEAMAAYREAIRLDPSYGLAHFNKGNLHKDERQWGEAIEAYKEAAKNGYDMSHVHMNMGLIFLDNSDLAQAVACFRRSIELDSQATGSHIGLGLALLELGLRDDARDSCATALEISPEMALARTCIQRASLDTPNPEGDGAEVAG